MHADGGAAAPFYVAPESFLLGATDHRLPTSLAIEVKDTGAFKAIGTVTFMNSGKPEQVVLDLLRSGNDWRIADVAWDSGTLRALYRRHAARDSEPTPR